MNKHLGFGAAMLLGGTALAGAWSQPAMADTINVQVYAAFAPNHNDGLSAYSAWTQNAISAIETNQTSAGTPGTPSFFQVAPSYADPSANVVTNFSSWNGVANPGGAYSNEGGNRLTFIAVVTDSTGAGINLSQLSETVTAGPTPTGAGQSGVLNDSFNWGTGTLNYYTYGGVPQSYTPGAAFYTASQIGLDGSGNKITTDGSTAATTNVNELIVVGWGNALANSSSPACSALGSTQAAISCVEGLYGQMTPFAMTGEFSLGGASGSADVTFAPEPATLALFGSAIAGLGMLGRRRKKA